MDPFEERVLANIKRAEHLLTKLPDEPEAVQEPEDIADLAGHCARAAQEATRLCRQAQEILSPSELEELRASIYALDETHNLWERYLSE